MDSRGVCCLGGRCPKCARGSFLDRDLRREISSLHPAPDGEGYMARAYDPQLKQRRRESNVNQPTGTADQAYGLRRAGKRQRPRRFFLPLNARRLFARAAPESPPRTTHLPDKRRQWDLLHKRQDRESRRASRVEGRTEDPRAEAEMQEVNRARVHDDQESRTRQCRPARDVSMPP